MSEKQGLVDNQPPPPPYQQSVPPGYQHPPVPSYAQGAPPQPGYGTRYGQPQTVIVSQPGGYRSGVVAVDDHMTMAILSTVLCCWPIGIVAIFRAQEARRAADVGDISSALMLSAQAKRLSMAATFTGIAIFVVTIVIVIAVVVSA